MSPIHSSSRLDELRFPLAGFFRTSPPFAFAPSWSVPDDGLFPLPLALPPVSLLLSLLVVRSSYSSAASSSAITCLMDCMGIGRLLIMSVPSLYMHCWLSSVVSERLMAPTPSRLRLAGTPSPAGFPPPVLPGWPTRRCWDYLLNVKWFVSVALAAAEDDMPKPPVVFVFLLSRSVVFSAMDCLLVEASPTSDIIFWLPGSSDAVFMAAFVSMTTVACGRVSFIVDGFSNGLSSLMSFIA